METINSKYKIGDWIKIISASQLNENGDRVPDVGGRTKYIGMIAQISNVESDEEYDWLYRLSLPKSIQDFEFEGFKFDEEEMIKI